jgi:hypothetical protein
LPNWSWDVINWLSHSHSHMLWVPFGTKHELSRPVWSNLGWYDVWRTKLHINFLFLFLIHSGIYSIKKKNLWFSMPNQHLMMEKNRGWDQLSLSYNNVTFKMFFIFFFPTLDKSWVTYLIQAQHPFFLDFVRINFVKSNNCIKDIKICLVCNFVF